MTEELKQFGRLGLIVTNHVVGQVLHSSTGTWSNNPIRFDFQWQRDGVPIQGAFDSGVPFSQYLIQGSDVRRQLRCLITAYNQFGSSSFLTADSGAILDIFALPVVGVPTIIGAPQQGSTLTAVPGAWGGGGVTFTYQWYRVSGSVPSQISGADLSYYVPQQVDVGLNIYVVVIGSNPVGTASASSSQTGTIAVATQVLAGLPVNITNNIFPASSLYPSPSLFPGSGAAPSISGTVKLGQTLTVSPGLWTGNPTFSYQWYAFGLDATSNGSIATNNPVSGATNPTFLISSQYAGYTLSCVVTATNGFGSVVVTIPSTVAVAVDSTVAIPTISLAPTLSGTLQQGSTLSLTNGTWTNTPTSFGYQWFKVDLSNQQQTFIGNQISYLLTAADVGYGIVGKVLARNNGGSTLTNASYNATVAGTPTPAITSGAVVTVFPPVNTTAPTITGQAQVNSTLSVSNGIWTNSPTFKYEWWQVGATTKIASATNNSYVPVAGDVGKQIYAVVIGTNSAASGGVRAQSSNTTAAVVSQVVVVSTGATVRIRPSVTSHDPTPGATNGGWACVLADGFGGSSVDTNFWVLSNGKGHNGNEIETFSPSKVSIDPSLGLTLAATKIGPDGGIGVKNIVAAEITGGSSTSHPAQSFHWNPGVGGNWCFESNVTCPYNERTGVGGVPHGGGADPSFWTIGVDGTGGNEFDFFEFWNWGTNSPSNFGTIGTWLIYPAGGGNGSQVGGSLQKTDAQIPAWMDNQPHTWTHFFNDTTQRIDVFIDGVLQGSRGYTGGSFPSHPTMTLLLMHAYRNWTNPAWLVGQTRNMYFRNVAVYRDTGHVGQGYIGGGIASGTTVA